MILYSRVINLVLSVCMIVASLLSLLTTDNATTGVLACYVVVFSCLLCCFETHLKQISKVIALNFGFLYSAKSRSVFMIFVGKFFCCCWYGLSFVFLTFLKIKTFPPIIAFDWKKAQFSSRLVFLAR